MATQYIPRLTEEQYLELDRANSFRSEYIDGEMLAMSGGSLRHSALAVDLAYILKQRLVGRGCTLFNSDARVRVPAKCSYLYPDISVVCGDVITQENTTDVLINPIVLFEVLSPATRSFDRGRKFELYREITSLKDYILIDSESIRASSYSRQPDESWLFRESIGMDASLSIPALSLTIPMEQIYADSEHLAF